MTAGWVWALLVEPALVGFACGGAGLLLVVFAAVSAAASFPDVRLRHLVAAYLAELWPYPIAVGFCAWSAAFVVTLVWRVLVVGVRA